VTFTVHFTHIFSIPFPFKMICHTIFCFVMRILRFRMAFVTLSLYIDIYINIVIILFLQTHIYTYRNLKQRDKTLFTDCRYAD